MPYDIYSYSFNSYEEYIRPRYLTTICNKHAVEEYCNNFNILCSDEKRFNGTIIRDSTNSLPIFYNKHKSKYLRELGIPSRYIVITYINPSPDEIVYNEKPLYEIEEALSYLEEINHPNPISYSEIYDLEQKDIVYSTKDFYTGIKVFCITSGLKGISNMEISFTSIIEAIIWADYMYSIYKHIDPEYNITIEDSRIMTDREYIISPLYDNIIYKCKYEYYGDPDDEEVSNYTILLNYNNRVDVYYTCEYYEAMLCGALKYNDCKFSDKTLEIRYIHEDHLAFSL